MFVRGPTWAYKQGLSNKTDHDRKLHWEKPACLTRAVHNQQPVSLYRAVQTGSELMSYRPHKEKRVGI
jgi:hypothetical protein